MRADRRVALFVLVSLLLLLAVAVPAMAGHGDEGGTVSAVDRPPPKFFAFSPQSVSIPAGTNLRFKNESAEAPHTLSDIDGSFDSGVVFAGDEVIVATEHLEPGTYTFFCRVHPDLMQGTLKVKK